MPSFILVPMPYFGYNRVGNESVKPHWIFLHHCGLEFLHADSAATAMQQSKDETEQHNQELRCIITIKHFWQFARAVNVIPVICFFISWMGNA